MIDAGFGIFDRLADLQRAAQDAPLAIGIAVDEEAHEIGDVLLGARQPVLQRQEIGADILGRARDEAQNLRQPAQHLHLAGAAAGRLALVAAQTLEQGHRAARRAIHPEAAQARHLGDFAGRHDADHRVAGLAPRLQRRQQRQEMIFHEQHRVDHDVGGRDRLKTARERARIGGPFGCRMNAELEPGQIPLQREMRPHCGAGDMGIHGDDDDAHRRGAAEPILRHGRGHVSTARLALHPGTRLEPRTSPSP